MALITCPKCGKEISDNALYCTGCGCALGQQEETIAEEAVKCLECGAELPMDAETCPNCGCPVEKNEVAGEAEAENKGKSFVKKVKTMNKKKRNLIIAISAVVLVVIGVVIAICAVNSSKKNYREAMSAVSSAILIDGAAAEDAGNLIKSVWYNTIYEVDSIETDKYTKKPGYYYKDKFHDDFNTSLGLLFADPEFSQKIEKIKDGQFYIDSLMKKLQNPPDEYVEAYQAIKELYDAYLSLKNMVVNVSGNYNTFRDNFNEYDAALLKCYNKVKLYLDN